ncbi:winged helix-turn-helix domain-containing protein [Deinococcus sp.]|uniref:winged helix-turn-helix domain-containing protein n=1 Tax=Deinococcus sp. TaxID=47478 RepID=UPI003C7AD8B8
MAGWIEERVGHPVNVGAGWNYLRRLQYTVQLPRPQHPQAASLAEQDAFKKIQALFETLKAVSPARFVELRLQDEARLGTKSVLRRHWASRGAVPPALHDNGFAWTYIYGFVHPYTGRSDLLRFDTVDVESFSAALALFKARFDPADERLLVLVVDHAGWHRSPRVVVPLGIQLVCSLPYTPELMPAEHLWLPLKEGLVNRA